MSLARALCTSLTRVTRFVHDFVEPPIAIPCNHMTQRTTNRLTQAKKRQDLGPNVCLNRKGLCLKFVAVGGLGRGNCAMGTFLM